MVHLTALYGFSAFATIASILGNYILQILLIGFQRAANNPNNSLHRHANVQRNLRFQQNLSTATYFLQLTFVPGCILMALLHEQRDAIMAHYDGIPGAQRWYWSWGIPALAVLTHILSLLVGFICTKTLRVDGAPVTVFWSLILLGGYSTYSLIWMLWF